MKKRYFTLALAAIAILLPAQSCLKEQEDYFDESSSARMTSYLNFVQAVLTEGTGEWIMDYYPGSGQAYGGYAYYLTFSEQTVDVAFEFDPENTYTSRYKFTTDNGPVLSFDTYNEALHYFATPSSKLYQAYGGDFEFTILSYEENTVVLKGKRSGNKYTLRRSDGTYTAKEYVAAVEAISEEFKASDVEGTIGGGDVTGSVDCDTRSITLVYGPGEEDYVTEPFVFTPKGLKLYEPIKVNGCTIDELYYLYENNILTNGVFILYGKLPDDYKAYGEFLGDFELCYNGSVKLNVTLTENADKSGVIMSGFNPNFDVELSYVKSKGRLNWCSQQVGTNGNDSIFLCSWSSTSGYLTWNTSAGMYVHWVEADQQFEFEDNGGWVTYLADSFLVWELNSSNSSVGEYKGYGTSRYSKLSYLKRK